MWRDECKEMPLKLHAWQFVMYEEHSMIESLFAWYMLPKSFYRIKSRTNVSNFCKFKDMIEFREKIVKSLNQVISLWKP